jgi:hypothetical protein
LQETVSQHEVWVRCSSDFSTPNHLMGFPFTKQSKIAQALK